MARPTATGESAPGGKRASGAAGGSCPICARTGFSTAESEDGIARARRCSCLNEDRAGRLMGASRIPRRYLSCSLAHFDALNPSLPPEQAARGGFGRGDRLQLLSTRNRAASAVGVLNFAMKIRENPGREVRPFGVEIEVAIGGRQRRTMPPILRWCDYPYIWIVFLERVQDGKCTVGAAIVDNDHLGPVKACQDFCVVDDHLCNDILLVEDGHYDG